LSSYLPSVHADTPSQAGRTLSITVTSDVSTTNNACKSSDDDNIIEALFREIVTSPCIAQDAAEENRSVSIAGSESMEVVDGCGDETRSGWHLVEMGDSRVRATQTLAREGEEVIFVDEDTEFRDYSAAEWRTEMETQRLLDEMIAMTGLEDGGESAPEYSEIGLSVGLVMDLDLSTLSSWDMDAAVDCIGAH
jgi:hypothetical protein